MMEVFLRLPYKSWAAAGRNLKFYRPDLKISFKAYRKKLCHSNSNRYRYASKLGFRMTRIYFRSVFDKFSWTLGFWWTSIYLKSVFDEHLILFVFFIRFVFSFQNKFRSVNINKKIWRIFNLEVLLWGWFQASQEFDKKNPEKYMTAK
jgi:hypothetical protein